MADDIMDADFERRMEMTQWRAGRVLTEQDAQDIQTLFDELEEAERGGDDAFERGVQLGRKEAGGATIAGLLRMIDSMRTDLFTARAMSRFWRAMAAQRSPWLGGKLSFKVGRLDGNRHRQWRDAAGALQFATLRNTARLYPLGRDSWQLTEGRTLIGRRLYFYGRTGACIHFDLMLRFERSPYRPPSRYAPQVEAS